MNNANINKYNATIIILAKKFDDCKQTIDKLPDCFDSIIIVKLFCGNQGDNLIELSDKIIAVVSCSDSDKICLKYIYEITKLYINTKWLCFIGSNEYFDNRFQPNSELLNNSNIKAIAIYKVKALNSEVYYSNTTSNEYPIFIDGAIYNLSICAIDQVTSTDYNWLNTYDKTIGKTLVISLDNNDIQNDIKRDTKRINSIYSVANKYDSYERINDNDLKKILQNRIDKLSNYLLTEKGNRSISLYSGDSGQILYLAQIYLMTKEEKYLIKIYELIESLDLDTFSITTSFCSGLAGYGWLINYLVKHDILEVSDEYFDEIDSILSEQLKIEINNKQFDQMHNAISIGRYFICRNNHTTIAYLLNELSRNKITTDNEIKWESFNFSKNIFKYDFGLAHGMGGILYFISKCYQLEIEKELCLELVRGVFNFYKNNEQDYNKCNSFFPAAVSTSNYSPLKRDHNIRLAWCYGDAGLLYSLFLCGKKMNIDELINYSLEKLREITKRIDTIDTAINDAGFCHGSSSLVHIYNKLYLFTNEDIFLQAANYWSKVTIILGSNNTSKSGYLFFPDLQNWVENNSLLEGVSGVALSLLSLQYNKDIDWDECMML